MAIVSLKNGVKISFKLYYAAEYQQRQILSMVVAENAKNLDIEIELIGTDWDSIYSNQYNFCSFISTKFIRSI